MHVIKQKLSSYKELIKLVNEVFVWLPQSYQISYTDL